MKITTFNNNAIYNEHLSAMGSQGINSFGLPHLEKAANKLAVDIEEMKAYIVNKEYKLMEKQVEVIRPLFREFKMKQVFSFWILKVELARLSQRKHITITVASNSSTK